MASNTGDHINNQYKIRYYRNYRLNAFFHSCAFARIFTVSTYTFYSIFTQVNVERSIKHK